MPAVIQFKLVDDVGLPIAGTAVTFAVTPRAGATLPERLRAHGRIMALPAPRSSSAPRRDNSASAPPPADFPCRTPSAALSGSHPRITPGGVSRRGQFRCKQAGRGGVVDRESAEPGLSAFSDSTPFDRLPLALDFVMASFDVPSANPPISVPAHMVAVGPTQIFVQAPWELHGQTSAQLKVALNCSYSNVVTVPLADYAPAWFERTAGVVFAVDAERPGDHWPPIRRRWGSR